MKYKLNLANTIKSTEKKSLFLSIGENETLNLRFLPPTLENGSLFLLTTSHFKLAEGDKGVAYACRRVHKDEDCPLCSLAYHLMDNGDAAEQKIGKEIRPSNNWYAQVLRGDEQEDGSLKWTGPFLMRFSKTGVDALTEILRNQIRVKQSPFCDIEKGQYVAFTRTGKGFDTKYSAYPSGEVVDLNEIYPEWEDKIIDDIEGALELKHKDPQEMIDAAVAAHPQVDWDSVAKEMGWE